MLLEILKPKLLIKIKFLYFLNLFQFFLCFFFEENLLGLLWFLSLIQVLNFGFGDCEHNRLGLRLTDRSKHTASRSWLIGRLNVTVLICDLKVGALFVWRIKKLERWQSFSWLFDLRMETNWQVPFLFAQFWQIKLDQPAFFGPRPLICLHWLNTWAALCARLSQPPYLLLSFPFILLKFLDEPLVDCCLLFQIWVVWKNRCFWL